jgi:tetratricopeptide (TPR) repeat protein
MRSGSGCPFWRLFAESAGGALVRELTAAPDLDGWTIVGRLIEDLAPLDERTWLVIDDLDELRSDEAMQQLECFVKCSPRNLQFALSSRTDLHLGLHRLRVDGELTEIRTPDLIWRSVAHLGIAPPLSGLSPSAALAFSEEAVTIAEAHGLATNPIVALAFAIGAGSLAWLGRFDEAEQWLERAGLALRPGGDPGTELALHHARGLRYAGQGRLADALAEFRDGEKIQGMLAGEHALMVDLRARIMLTEVRMGGLSDARAALDSVAEQNRDRAEVRIPAAAIYIARAARRKLSSCSRRSRSARSSPSFRRRRPFTLCCSTPPLMRRSATGALRRHRSSGPLI